MAGLVKGLRLLAHRCAALNGPENTLEGMRRCREEGADAIEVDVRLTKDGEPVLFHDPDARRLAGSPARIRDLSWKEVRALRVFGRHAVPHLDEALAEAEPWRGVELFVDLHERRAELALAAARSIGRSAMRERAYLLAFYRDRELLARARSAFPALRLAVMPGAPWNIEGSARLGAAALCLGWDRALTRRLYRAAAKLWDIPAALARPRAEGLAVSGGIGNTAEDLLWLRGQGFTELWTDDLRLARRALA